MRQIKFRAWDKERKKMNQVQLMDWSDWWVSVGHTWEREKPSDLGERNSFKNEETDRHILMQFTGLKDKNGVEIYEGDIIEMNCGCDSEYGCSHGTYKIYVAWYQDIASFELMEMDGKYSGEPFEDTMQDEWEIIGNIYANPELLKGGDSNGNTPN